MLKLRATELREEARAVTQKRKRAFCLKRARPPGLRKAGLGKRAPSVVPGHKPTPAPVVSVGLKLTLLLSFGAAPLPSPSLSPWCAQTRLAAPVQGLQQLPLPLAGPAQL